MLPVPVPPVMNNVEAGPSKLTVSKRTRAGERRAAKEAATTSATEVTTTSATEVEPTIVDDEHGKPRRKRARKATPKPV